MNTREIDERSVRMWAKAGYWMWRRPVTVIATGLGLILVVVALAYSTVTSSINDGDINTIQKALCVKDAGDFGTEEERVQNCRQLLDQILAHPTAQQAERLREIVKETP